MQYDKISHFILLCFNGVRMLDQRHLLGQRKLLRTYTFPSAMSCRFLADDSKQQKPSAITLNQKQDCTTEFTRSSSDTVKVYRLEGWTHPQSASGVQVKTENTGQTMATDLPRHMGGQNLAPQPVELLLAAWMGCTQATALFVARHMRGEQSYWRKISLDRLEFASIEACRDERGSLELPLSSTLPVPSRLMEVNGTIHVYLRDGNRGDSQAKGSSLSSYLEMLRHQTELRCPVANMMIASGCEMKVEWIIAHDNDDD